MSFLNFCGNLKLLRSLWCDSTASVMADNVRLREQNQTVHTSVRELIIKNLALEERLESLTGESRTAESLLAKLDRFQDGPLPPGQTPAPPATDEEKAELAAMSQAAFANVRAPLPGSTPDNIPPPATPSSGAIMAPPPPAPPADAPQDA